MTPCKFSHTLCHIDLGALKRNFLRCGNPAMLMPVLKSDAYGHGLLECARALASVGAERFAVGCADEGRALREAGFLQDIVPLMAQVTDEDWELVTANGLMPLVCSMEQLEAASTRATKDHPLSLAIKLETGMHRQGFREEQLPQVIEKIRQNQNLVPRLALSHCSCADIPERHDYTLVQVDRFERMATGLAAAFPDMKASLFNSAGVLDTTYRHNMEDISRPGVVLYGGNPFAGTSKETLGANLEWTMSLSTPILQVTSLRKGEGISYGHLFHADRDMKIAVAGAGYANALPRALTSRLDALLHGKRVRSVGRVCMNMTMFDVSGMEDVKAGDELWLLGGEALPGVKPVTPQEWAEKLGTISYEVICLVGNSNARVWHE
ncbi:alanine racemase [Desulfovibrio sp. An276]|mgnify:CR=1 FL=1|uniref:alanine racemase n=1 Tax=Desulfovibrio sp. An276 TaxID=1965618 RepID=UPI000B37AE06|nr:alanine racemase [Desulfovibrio sp. An276]OUO49497.1 alanine racemase [Desulfovibrio sp. An276]